MIHSPIPRKKTKLNKEPADGRVLLHMDGSIHHPNDFLACQPYAVVYDVVPETIQTCLVIEEPADDRYFALNRGGHLDRLGKLSLARWEYIKQVHVVLPNSQQGYIISRLDVPHYSATIPEVIQAMRKARKE